MATQPATWSRGEQSPLYVTDHEITVVSVLTTPTLILKPDPMRISLIITGYGAYYPYIGFNDQVSVNNGFWVGSNEQPIFINEETMPGAAGRALWAITSNVASNLAVMYARIIE